MKQARLLCVLCLAAMAAMAQTPTITAVQNAAANIPPGLPNSSIAQGSMFAIYGTNLGPANLAIATAFPLTTNEGGTTVSVTVGGTTVSAIMYYSLPTQVAAILPSKTPTGTGTVKVTYNGQSATAPITVVQNNIGIFTVNSGGTGDAIAFLADNGLITPSHAANPGDIVIFWGTGLGPVTTDETQPAVEVDMPNVPIQVFIGGQQANVLFRGRNACCSSVDVVYARVPPGVSGCAVAVNMQMGNIAGNATTIAVADTGRTCTAVSPNPTVGGTGTHSFGGLTLERIVEIIDVAGTTTTTKSDTVGGTFEKITFSSSAPPQGSQIDVNSYGSCTVAYAVSGKTATPPPTATVQYLDAGATIGLAAPFGNRSIPRTTSSGITYYLAALDQTATTLTGGQYTFTGTGGADVGAFTTTYTMPPAFAWTNQTSITTVNRANGVTVTWTGGDPSGYVTITGSSVAYGATAASTTSVGFTCTARVSDGTFTVPPVVLLALPPSGNIPGTSFASPGTLSLTSVSAAQLFQQLPTGIDAAATTSAFIYAGTVTYQ